MASEPLETTNEFSLDSTEAARVNDVFAKATASSALDFSKLAVQFPIVGATAKAAGVSLERTASLLGINLISLLLLAESL